MIPAILLPIAACLGLAGASLGAHAELRLDADAFVSPPVCRVEPFADASVAQYLDEVGRSCGGASTRFELASPRENASDSGPGLLKAQALRVDTRSFGPLLTTFRWAWSAGGESDGRLRTEHAMFGAGGLLRLDPTLALRAQLGQEAAGEGRKRARFAGLWEPRRNHLLFAEWAGSDDTDQHAVGMRWYLIPKRVALDLATRRTPDGGGWAAPRIGLLLPGLGQ